MKKHIATMSLLLACAASSAMAQTITSGNWAGNYAGIYTSYSSGTSNFANATVSTGDFDLEGYVAGFTLGQNFQNNQFVYGFEMSIGQGMIDGITNVSCSSCIAEISSTASLSGRAGYAVNRFLPYVTAGLTSAFISGEIASIFGAEDHVMGYSAGLGVEYAYSDTLSIDIRALYTDFGDLLIPASPEITLTNETYSVRFGMNYHF